MKRLIAAAFFLALVGGAVLTGTAQPAATDVPTVSTGELVPNPGTTTDTSWGG
ncbi:MULTISPECIES: hypothetical protein [Actinoplanes]|uniref:hypothetical protein n=1 Tax=Actinoplanes TaxID=1865 RepID=UPI000B15CD6E|nr:MULTISPECIES: hypothetical protein [Actinoplanes]GLY04028.1 hypothetical protein Acsp01_44070 [Actinoplanes sp. NBRC 101535]